MVYPINRRKSLASGLALLTVSHPHLPIESLPEVYHGFSFQDKLYNLSK